uniref:Uncharacterized protein n=1 Tax=Anguilla anguilla TaxID=7936 RepID=A0A0E9XFF0_ANGAN
MNRTQHFQRFLTRVGSVQVRVAFCDNCQQYRNLWLFLRYPLLEVEKLLLTKKGFKKKKKRITRFGKSAPHAFSKFFFYEDIGKRDLSGFPVLATLNIMYSSVTTSASNYNCRQCFGFASLWVWNSEKLLYI